jgi:hypothetical protein
MKKGHFHHILAAVAADGDDVVVVFGLKGTF